MSNNNLPTLLAELATVAPQICRPVNDEYIMQGFVFFIDKKVGLTATLLESNGTIIGSATGNPALAWLQDALQRVIDNAPHLECILELHKIGNHRACVIKRGAPYNAYNNNVAIALLTALIAAIREEGE